MSEITITPMEPGTYGVQVTEGDTTTSHRVHVPEEFGLDLGVPDADPELVVRETILFLLDREPNTAILAEFSLDDVSRYYADFRDELARRLKGVTS